MRERKKGMRLLALAVLVFTLQTIQADLLIFSHQNVFRYDESGTLLSKAVRNFDAESIDAVATGLDGNIYALGNTLGSPSVLRFDRLTGLFRDVFVPEQEGLSITRSLAIGTNGDLYVTIHVFSGPPVGTNQYIALLQFDGQTGAFNKTLIALEDAIQGSGAIEAGADGILYLAESRGIVRYDANSGAFIDVFTAARPELAVAQTIFFGKDGNLYVVGNDSIYRIDSQTGELLGKLIEGVPDLSSAVAVGADGDIYLRKTSDRNILRFDGKTGQSKGIFISNIGSSPYDDSISALTFFGPRLTVNTSSQVGIQVRWNSAFQDFAIEANDDLSGSWLDVTNSATKTGNEMQMNVTFDSPNRVFRLIKR